LRLEEAPLRGFEWERKGRGEARQGAGSRSASASTAALSWGRVKSTRKVGTLVLHTAPALASVSISAWSSVSAVSEALAREAALRTEASRTLNRV
jgi:hypothetical protein